MADTQSGPRRRTFAWLASFVAVSAAAAGFVDGSARKPVDARGREVVTEYRTVAPEIGVAELASERQRLNRIKRNLNARKKKLDRRRASLDAREAVLDAREAALGGREEDVTVAGAQSTRSNQSEGAEQRRRREQSAAGAPSP